MMRSLLLAASSEGLTIDEVNPVWLQDAGRAVVGGADRRRADRHARLLRELVWTLQPAFRFCGRSKVSAGGWFRSDEHYFVSDLAAELGLPVMVVAINRLGCLNHTMLTVAQHRSPRPEMLREWSLNIWRRGMADLASIRPTREMLGQDHRRSGSPRLRRRSEPDFSRRMAAGS